MIHVRYVRRLWPAHAHIKSLKSMLMGSEFDRVLYDMEHRIISTITYTLDLVQWRWRPQQLTSP